MAKRMMDIGVTYNTGDETSDLTVSGGDFVVVESTLEHVRNLISCAPGEFKENPVVGVGAVNYIDDENPSDLLQKITEQLRKDGMDVKQVALEGGIIKTEAFYK